MQHKALVCAINNVQVTTVPLGLPKAYWEKPNILHLDYVTTVQYCQIKLNLETITAELDDPGHPDFRLHKRNPPRFYKYLSGVPISSGSEKTWSYRFSLPGKGRNIIIIIMSKKMFVKYINCVMCVVNAKKYSFLVKVRYPLHMSY